MAFTSIVSTTVTGETVSSGTQSIVNGGIANKSFIINGGTQNISSGGITNSSLITSNSQQNVYFGGIANFTTNNGCWFSVFSGGVANITTLNSGGYLLLSSGGIANSTTIVGGGALMVAGVANFTTINSSGRQIISSGGVANSTIINSGGSRGVGSGGTVNSTTINSGGYQWVDSGGVANFTTINSGGRQWVDSGGIASVINQQTGAAIIANTGARITGGTNTRTDGHSEFSIVSGVASNFLLENNGSLTVSAGHSAIDTVIASGCVLRIDAGGVANVINQQSGAAIIADTTYTNITNGINTRTDGHSAFSIVSGVASNFLLESGGSLTVSSGHSSIDTVIVGGNQYVSSGGVANSTTISQYGWQNIYSGGIANSTTINNDGRQYVSSGGIVNSTTIGGGGADQCIYGTANSTTINFGGLQEVIGTANSTTINSGGVQLFYAGGQTNSTTINSGGVQNVVFSATANSTTINSGGIQNVNGVANSTTINSGGSQSLWYGSANVINQQSGATIIVTTSATITGGTNTRTDGHSAFSIVSGIASNFLLESGGSLTVSAGHSAIDTVIASGGSQNIYSSGVANSTTINSGGIQIVSSGGTANSTTINSGGEQHFYAGGTANSTTINFGGKQNVDFSATATSTTINTGGEQNIAYTGSATFTIINAGGRQTVSSGCTVNNTTINSGGSMNVYHGSASVINQQSGAVIITNTYTNITNGINTRTDGHSAFSIVSGVASNFLLENGGQLTVMSGHSSINTVITSGGNQIVSYGGTVNSTTINSGGIQIASSGGTANTTTINSGGNQSVFYWGDANTTTINSGGNQSVSGYGATANSTTINSSGIQTVFSGGSANTATINNCGEQIISSGGTANSTAINSSGSQEVWGTANTTTINSGGYQIVNSGGVTSNTAINSGGSMFVSSGGLVNGALEVAGGHATFANADSFNNLGDVTYELNTAKLNDTLITINSGSLNYYGPDYSLNLNNAVAGTYELIDGADLSALKGTYIEVAGSDNSGKEETHFLMVGTSRIFGNGDKLSLSLTDGATDQLTAIITTDNIPVDTVGDTRDTAAALGVNSSKTEFVGLGDLADYYQLTLTNAGTLSLSLSGLTAGAILTLLDSYDNELSYTYKTEWDEEPDSMALVAGTYYVKVEPADDGTDNGYTNYTLSNTFINDVLPLPTITISITDATAGEPADNGTFRINRAGDTANALTVYFSTVGTATGGSDYSLKNGSTALTNSVVIAAGQSYVDVTLDVIDDTVVEGTETAIMNLSANSTYSLGATTSGTINITDNDVALPIVTIAATNASAGEPANNGTFRINRAGDTANALTVYFSTVGTATGGSDYSLKNGSTALTNSVVIAAGQSYVDVTLDVIDDTVVEGTETAIMNLSANDAYELGATTATVNITDNDVADTLPPTVPSSLKQTVTASSVAFDWADSTDKSGIKQYEFRVDNNSDFSSQEYTNTVTASQGTGTDIPVGTYYWQVRSQDNAGNWSAWSKSSSFMVIPEDTVGNTLTTAGVLETNGFADEWVGFGDAADYYKLTLDTAGKLSLNLADLTGDANMTLYDAKGKSLKSSSLKGLADENIANLSLTGGDYYVKVAPASGVFDASYKLSNVVDYFPADTVGNTLATSGVLETNGFADEWVGFGDTADYYKLTLDSAGKLSLNLADLTGDANMTLYDAKGKSLKSSSVKGLADENIANLSLAGGDYYVKVAPASGVFDASYKLSNVVDYFPADTVGNTQTNARILDVNGFSDEWVGFGDTADFYKLTMTNAGKLSLNLADLTGDANMTLYDAKGKSLKSSSVKGLADENIANLSLTGGDYYVKVAPASGVFDASYKLSNVVDYFPADTAGNTFALAKPVTETVQVDEWLGFGDKDDYYMFELQASTAVTLDLADMTSNVNMYLYDSKSRQLAASAKSGNTDESITKTLAAGKYYVKATLAGKENTDYSLNFGIDPSAFKTGSLQLSSAASPLTGSADASQTDPLKKNNGLLAS